LGTHLLVIAIAVAISGALITDRAAQLFMVIMTRYHIDPTVVEQDFLGAVHRVLITGSVIAAAAAMLLGWILVRRLLHPISDMMLLSERIAAGDYAQRVAAQGPDELVRLADSLNRMAASLQRIEGLRRDLVANVAHELRTPLSTLQGYLEGMRDGVVPVSRDTLDSLHDEVLRLVRLVDTLQQLSQFDARVAGPRLAPLDVAGVARQVAALYEPELRARGLSLDVLGDAGDAVVLADADLVGQAVRNLLDNALRYAAPDTAVTVRAASADGAVRLEVQNLGDEICPEDLPHIFERFYRGEKSRSRDTGGAGIGLALVREIARAHGGDAGAASAAGRTTVWLTLPRAGRAAAANNGVR
jgi:signal transduction histidine kinase